MLCSVGTDASGQRLASAVPLPAPAVRCICATAAQPRWLQRGKRPKSNRRKYHTPDGGSAQLLYSPLYFRAVAQHASVWPPHNGFQAVDSLDSFVSASRRPRHPHRAGGRQHAAAGARAQPGLREARPHLHTAARGAPQRGPPAAAVPRVSRGPAGRRARRVPASRVWGGRASTGGPMTIATRTVGGACGGNGGGRCRGRCTLGLTYRQSLATSRGWWPCSVL